MLDTVRWLRRGAVAWRWHSDATMLAPPMVQGAALSAATTQAAVVTARWHEIHASVGTGGRLRDQWARHIRAARARLEVGDSEGPHRLLYVWTSQLHMLLNRLGVRPDEERSLDWFIAAALRAPDGPADFFADHTGSPDRRYLEASNFAVNRMAWQQPRVVPPGQARLWRNPSAGPGTRLPDALPIAVPLGTALAGRVTGRGELGGTVTAQDLGTLLWSAYASPAGHDRRTGYQQWPYPSAGAKYVARLRLIVRSVEGVAPGHYEVDRDSRTLQPLGRPPTAEELTATSMWFDPDPPAGKPTQAQDRIHVSTLPAVLGLYVDLGTLRASYGMRALRFALLEAGHLAQNLALVAASTRLALGLVGGFYDDVAHEVFLLDGIDEVLVYLLPLGRRLTD
jgi:SagB-type dehydrogenase family enzyme